MFGQHCLFVVSISCAIGVGLDARFMFVTFGTGSGRKLSPKTATATFWLHVFGGGLAGTTSNLCGRFGNETILIDILTIVLHSLRTLLSPFSSLVPFLTFFVRCLGSAKSPAHPTNTTRTTYALVV